MRSLLFVFLSFSISIGAQDCISHPTNYFCYKLQEDSIKIEWNIDKLYEKYYNKIEEHIEKQDLSRKRKKELKAEIPTDISWKCAIFDDEERSLREALINYTRHGYISKKIPELNSNGTTFQNRSVTIRNETRNHGLTHSFAIHKVTSTFESIKMVFHSREPAIIGKDTLVILLYNNGVVFVPKEESIIWDYSIMAVGYTDYDLFKKYDCIEIPIPKTERSFFNTYNHSLRKPGIWHSEIMDGTVYIFRPIGNGMLKVHTKNGSYFFQITEKNKYACISRIFEGLLFAVIEFVDHKKLMLNGRRINSRGGWLNETTIYVSSG